MARKVVKDENKQATAPGEGSVGVGNATINAPEVGKPETVSGQSVGQVHDEGAAVADADNGSPATLPVAPTPEDTAAALAVVQGRLDTVAGQLDAAGVAIAGPDGKPVQAADLFGVKPAVAPAAADHKCATCGLTFGDGPGLKRHQTVKHGKAAAAAPPPVVPQGRPERKPQDAAPPPPGAKASVVIKPDGIDVDALEFFDKFLSPHLPPPLEDWERALLRKAPITITIPGWLFKLGVYGLILGPRLWAKFFVLKSQFDKEVQEQEAKDRAEARAREAQAQAARQEEWRKRNPAPAPASLAVVDVKDETVNLKPDEEF